MRQIILIFFWLTITCHQTNSKNNSNLLNSKYNQFAEEIKTHIVCVRGHSVAISPKDIPTPPRIQKGQICRVEVEELVPFVSSAGHLFPKKFNCDFKYGDVMFFSNGNPLISEDVVKMTIYYDNDNSVVTADLYLKIINDNTIFGIKNSQFLTEGERTRVEQLKPLVVEGPRGMSNALSPEILRIHYESKHEECVLAYTSPDADQILDDQTVYYAGTKAPRHGLPLMPGLAIGGSKRWPIFGSLVTFNRTDLKTFNYDCQTALLMGFRYAHRKGNSPDRDYLPVEVTIYERNVDGSQKMVTRQGDPKFQVNLLHIGGTLSILPSDALMIPKDSVPDEDYLDVNITKIESSIKAQILNIRDPTRPIRSFRIRELRAGMIAIQYLEFSHQVEKMTKIHLVVVDPFYQISQPVILKIISHLQPAIPKPSMISISSFQVFTLPLYIHTGTISKILSHNIQVIGYIDKTQVGVKIFQNTQETLLNYTKDRESLISLHIPEKYKGNIMVGGKIQGDRPFYLTSLAQSQVTYECPKGFGPLIHSLTLSIGIKGYGFMDTSSWYIRKKRQSTTQLISQTPYLENITTIKPIFELPVRIFRIYDNLDSMLLASNVITTIAHRSFQCLTSEQLIISHGLQALRSDLVDLLFDVKMAPSQGILVRRSTLPSYGQNYREIANMKPNYYEGVFNSPFYDQSILSKFSFSELESGEICYLNQRDDREKDLFGLQQVGSFEFPSVYYEIMIKKVRSYKLKERMNRDTIILMKETDTFATISSVNLNYASDDTIADSKINMTSLLFLLPSEIIYEVTKPPTFFNTQDFINATEDGGRLVSLASCKSHKLIGDTNLQSMLVDNLREVQPPSVKYFSQQQIDEGDIVYVPPNKDVGFEEKNVAFEYSVTGPNKVKIYNRLVKIRITPVDNKKPSVQVLKSIKVSRDEEIYLNKEYFMFKDTDTKLEDLIIHVNKLPEFGVLLRESSYYSLSRNGSESEVIKLGSILTTQHFEESKLRYRQSGTNVRSDSFNLTITDGKQISEPITIKIEITDRVLLRPDWLKMINNSIAVQENGTVALHEFVFPTFVKLNSTTPDTNLRFICGVKPTKGAFVNKKGIKVNTFSTLEIRQQQILYQHGPNEIGTRAMFDFTRIFDYKTLRSFSLNFTITPVNSKAPVLKSHSPLDGNEGGEITLTPLTVTAVDQDTPEDELYIFVIQSPNWGEVKIITTADEDQTDPEQFFIENKINFKGKLRFKMKEIRDGRVKYVNSNHHDGIEVTTDAFVLQAYDGNFTSEPLTLNIVIQAINDEIPYVRLLRHISVPLAGKVVLTPHLLSVSDRDLPRDLLQIEFTRLPKYGDLYQYWKHGEETKITVFSSPITQIYLNMLNILYIQNSSLLPEKVANLTSDVLVTDSFRIKVNDGVHVVEKESEVLIRPRNRERPRLSVDGDRLTLDGSPWKSLYSRPGGLVVEDLDTLPEDLYIIVEEIPRYGLLKRTPRIESIGGSISIGDWIEAAWDNEEAEAKHQGHTRIAMTNAGSIGSLKSDKDLQRYDRFTKRQLLHSRIHNHFVEDKCVFRLTDGEFETGLVTLRIEIRKTIGYSDQRRVIQGSDQITLD